METGVRCSAAAVAPLLSTQALESLAGAIDRDCPVLIQVVATSPPPLACVADWPCQGACVLGYCGLAEGLETVGEVEEFFARMCAEIDNRLGEPAGCRWFLNWYDETARPEMLRLLGPEVALAIAGRTDGPGRGAAAA